MIRPPPPRRLRSCSVVGVADVVIADVVGSDDGVSHLGETVAEFDRRVDALFDRLRGEPTLDRLFLTASSLGDWSLVWHLLGLARGIARRRPDQVIALAVALGVESLVVNQGITRLFRRPRPTTAGADGLGVRAPSTSAFPSGHASVTATLRQVA